MRLRELAVRQFAAVPMVRAGGVILVVEAGEPALRRVGELLGRAVGVRDSHQVPVDGIVAVGGTPRRRPRAAEGRGERASLRLQRRRLVDCVRRPFLAALLLKPMIP